MGGPGDRWASQDVKASASTGRVIKLALDLVAAQVLDRP